MKGARIQRVCRIFTLAEKHKCVWHEGWGRHMPAAVLQFARARELRDWVRAGLIFTYKPKKKS